MFSARVTPSRPLHILMLVGMFYVNQSCPASAGPGSSEATGRNSPARRLIHHFDFDERGAGNLESLPRYWTPLQGDLFPSFTEGGFDDTVGRSAPPSFRIESLGRNVAFQYSGPEIPVRSESEYRVEGYVRMQDVRAARTCVSAHFMDEHRQPLLATTTRSPYLPPESSDWVQFDLQLPAAPRHARFLGLVVWILQDETWNDAEQPRISMVDVKAAAWLDDISVFRLPRVEMETRAPGNVLTKKESEGLWITLSDPANEQVSAELTIAAADGTQVFQRRLVVSGAENNTLEMDISRLEPGLYEARVDVVESGMTVVSRELRFAKIPASTGVRRRAATFGIALDHGQRAPQEVEGALLANQGARSVKIPISISRRGAEERAGSDRESERLYQALARDQFIITGSLHKSEPQEGGGVSPDELVSVLAGERSMWEESVATVATPAAGVFRWWQLGLDHHPHVDLGSRFHQAATQFHDVLAQYITAPRLGATVSAWDELPGEKIPAIDQFTLNIPPGIDLATCRERISAAKSAGYDAVSAFLPALPAGRFDRMERLSEWARRILTARHAGAETVYVPQPWSVRSTLHGLIVEPAEEYIVLHTIADMVGDTPADVAVSLERASVRCLAFRGAGRSVIAIWDEAPSPTQSVVALQLGETATTAVDLWGRVRPLDRDAQGRQLIEVSSSPVFVDHVQPVFIELASSVTLEPRMVESGTDLIRQELVLKCAAFKGGGGNGILVPPPGIEVTPRTFSVSACSGDELRIPVQVRYGHGEPAGEKIFRAQLTLDSPSCHVEIPLRVLVELSNIEVRGRALIERGDLLLRHTLHNQSESVVHFRSIAGVPGRERQYRPISSLGPGESQTIEYRFRDAANLIGRHVHLALRELNDGPRQHNLDLVVP